MIQVIKYNTENGREMVEKILSRSQLEHGNVQEIVNSILADIKARGDEAIFEYTLKFDKVNIDSSNFVVTDEEIEMGAKACECHMGEWSTDKRSSVVLPKPSDKYGELLHLCDYLASRKDIEVLFDNVPSAKVEVKLEDYKFTFGKYKGQLITEVAKEHKDYLEWMKGNMNMQEPLKTFVNTLLA